VWGSDMLVVDGREALKAASASICIALGRSGVDCHGASRPCVRYRLYGLWAVLRGEMSPGWMFIDSGGL
jgi:hypothetical protein